MGQHILQWDCRPWGALDHICVGHRKALNGLTGGPLGYVCSSLQGWGFCFSPAGRVKAFTLHMQAPEPTPLLRAASPLQGFCTVSALSLHFLGWGNGQTFGSRGLRSWLGDTISFQESLGCFNAISPGALLHSGRGAWSQSRGAERQRWVPYIDRQPLSSQDDCSGFMFNVSVSGARQ